MRKLLLALLLALASAVPAASQTQVICGNVTAGTATGTIATASTGRTIFLCGFHVVSTGAGGAFQISYGTGATCGTGTVALTAAISAVGAGGGAVDHNSLAYASVPAGNNLCVTTATTAAYAVYWAQQ